MNCQASAMPSSKATSRLKQFLASDEMKGLRYADPRLHASLSQMANMDIGQSFNKLDALQSVAKDIEEAFDSQGFRRFCIRLPARQRKSRRARNRNCGSTRRRSTRATCKPVAGEGARRSRTARPCRQRGGPASESDLFHAHVARAAQGFLHEQAHRQHALLVHAEPFLVQRGHLAALDHAARHAVHQAP